MSAYATAINPPPPPSDVGVGEKVGLKVEVAVGVNVEVGVRVGVRVGEGVAVAVAGAKPSTDPARARASSFTARIPSGTAIPLAHRQSAIPRHPIHVHGDELYFW